MGNKLCRAGKRKVKSCDEDEKFKFGPSIRNLSLEQLYIKTWSQIIGKRVGLYHTSRLPSFINTTVTCKDGSKLKIHEFDLNHDELISICPCADYADQSENSFIKPIYEHSSYHPNVKVRFIARPTEFSYKFTVYNDWHMETKCILQYDTFLCLLPPINDDYKHFLHPVNLAASTIEQFSRDYSGIVGSVILSSTRLPDNIVNFVVLRFIFPRVSDIKEISEIMNLT